MAINMSVWKDLDSLIDFVYRNEAHKSIMRRRREWFEKLEVYMVLWWIEENTLPSCEDALKKLAILQDKGATQAAFTFAKPFPMPAQ